MMDLAADELKSAAAALKAIKKRPQGHGCNYYANGYSGVGMAVDSDEEETRNMATLALRDAALDGASFQQIAGLKCMALSSLAAQGNERQRYNPLRRGFRLL